VFVFHRDATLWGLMAWALFCAPSCGPGSKAAKQSSPSNQVERKSLVRVEPITCGTIASRYILPGKIEPWERVVLSAEIGGRVEAFEIEANDPVTKGQVVALIDSEALRAQHEASHIRYEESVRVCDRLERLFELKNVTEDDIDKARSAMRLTEAQLRMSQVELEKSKVISPLRGLVNKKFVEKGEFVNKGEPMAEIVVLENLKFIVDVSERMVGHIDDKTEVSVSIESLSMDSIPAKVHRVALVGDALTHTFRVELALNGNHPGIKPGMLGRATFVEQRLEDVLIVPLFAVVSRGGGQFVFVAHSGRAEARKVDLGIVDGDLVQIKNGLAIGDRVVVKGARNLDHGTGIEVNETEGSSG